MFKPNQLRKRTEISFLLIGLILAVGIGSAHLTHQDTTLDLEYKVVSWSDPHQLHRITEMRVEVTNTGTTEIEPAFNIVHSGLQTRNYWEIQSGPETLAPHQKAIYTIMAPVPQFGIPIGGTMVLSINEVGTEMQRKKVSAADTDS